VYHFGDDDEVYSLYAKKSYKWKATSNKNLVISTPASELVLDLDLPKSQGVADYVGKKYLYILIGKY